jgi:hypothetical protein
MTVPAIQKPTRIYIAVVEFLFYAGLNPGNRIQKMPD